MSKRNISSLSSQELKTNHFPIPVALFDCSVIFRHNFSATKTLSQHKHDFLSIIFPLGKISQCFIYLLIFTLIYQGNEGLYTYLANSRG